MSLDKNIYLLENRKINDFSIHLMPPLNMPFKKGNAFLSLSGTDEKLDNMKPLLLYSKLYFFNPKYDRMTRTFTGNIYFPQTYKGVDRMDNTLVFSEDLSRTVSGRIVSKKVNGLVCGQKELADGAYKLMDL